MAYLPYNNTYLLARQTRAEETVRMRSKRAGPDQLGGATTEN